MVQKKRHKVHTRGGVPLHDAVFTLAKIISGGFAIVKVGSEDAVRVPALSLCCHAIYISVFLSRPMDFAGFVVFLRPYMIY